MPVWVMCSTPRSARCARTRGFAVAASELVVLVQTTWQGRLQVVRARRDSVSHRPIATTQRPVLGCRHQDCAGLLMHHN